MTIGEQGMNISAWYEHKYFRGITLLLLCGMLGGCAREKTLVLPAPLIEEQIKSVPLLYPELPLASHSLDRMAWADWLVWLQEPQLVDSVVRVDVSSIDGESLRKASEPWWQWVNNGAEQGDITAQVSLGMAYFQGTDYQAFTSSERKQLARVWLKKAAKQGSGFAAWQLARLLLDNFKQGQGVNPGELEHLLLQAANKNIQDAPPVLARLYRDGVGLVQNYEQSRYWYTVMSNSERSLSYRINAWLNLGLMDWFVKGGERRESSAVHFWKLAMDEGSAHGAYLYALATSNNRVSSLQSTLAALKAALAGGVNQANNQLGVQSWQQQDFSGSADWFERGNQVGDVLATYNLARSYIYGIGRAASAHRALIKLDKVIDKGFLDVERGAAFFYWQGPEDGPRDYGKARTLFQQAAQKGDLYSLYALGVIYGIGQGTRRDLPTAWANFSVVAAWGVHEAATLRDVLSIHMSEQERELGRIRAQTLFDNIRQQQPVLEITRQPPAIAVSLAKPKA